MSNNLATSEFSLWFQANKARIEAFLQQWLPASSQNKVCEAIRYSTLAGGKRLRPSVIYATAEIFGEDLSPVHLDHIAASVEVTHAYSLIHDDLPAMDDDAIRHNMPSCHVQYDEAIAILAGDAMQALSFDLLYEMSQEAGMGGNPLDNGVVIRICKELSMASGCTGMIEGQLIDLSLLDAPSGLQERLQFLEKMHARKTGALFSAAHTMVYLATASGGRNAIYHQLHQYGQLFGHIFQIQDDILDFTGDAEKMGKPLLSDQEAGKLTYATVLGVDGACDMRDEYIARAQALLDNFKNYGDTVRLQQLLDYSATRTF